MNEPDRPAPAAQERTPLPADLRALLVRQLAAALATAWRAQHEEAAKKSA